MSKAKELQELSIQELAARAGEIDREIFALRSELAFSRRLEKPHLMKAKKREKARVLTMLTQKQAVAL